MNLFAFRRSALALLLCSAFSAPAAKAQDLVDYLNSILQEVITSPIPTVLGPLVTLAQNADVVAIALLETTSSNRIRELMKQQSRCINDPACRRRLQRQIDLLDRLLGELTSIKNKRAGEKRKAEQDGSDPFAGRLMATGPLRIPGVNTFTLLLDGLGAHPLDAPPGPAVTLVTPRFAGSVVVTTPLLAASVTVDFVPVAPGRFDLSVLAFNATFAAYDIAPGVSTGPNFAALNPHGSTARGSYDVATAECHLQIEGVVTNAHYPASRPIVYYANIFGVLNALTGEVHVLVEDPMIVPEPPTSVPLQRPTLMGAQRLSFDASTSQLHLLENTTSAPGPDVSLVRWNDGSYNYDPLVDPVIGAEIIIDPLQLSGSSSPGVFEFDDTPMRIVKGGVTLLTGTLVDPVLDQGAGSLFAGWSILTHSSSSTALSELLTPSAPLTMQIAVGPAVYDLLQLTDNLTQSALLDLPETFHLGIAPCQGLVRTWGQGCSDGDRIPRMTFEGCPDVGEIAVIGTNFDPANTAPFFIAMGTSDSQWFGVPLPLALDPLGAPGCFIHVELGIVLPMSNPGGGGSLTLPIPPDPQLRDLQLHFQSLVLAPAANTLGLATSEAMTVTIK